jgi:hypothetical protein
MRSTDKNSRHKLVSGAYREANATYEYLCSRRKSNLPIKFISSRINCTNGFKASNVSTGISNEIQVKIREVKENDLWIIDANQILSTKQAFAPLYK